MENENKNQQIITDVSTLRGEVKNLGEIVKNLRVKIASSPTSGDNSLYPPEADTGEMIANAMLAYRHLEDAAMRLGKVIQAADGGKSCYPR
jgi:hypothetical protein